jgi:hypothetical protein
MGRVQMKKKQYMEALLPHLHYREKLKLAKILEEIQLQCVPWSKKILYAHNPETVLLNLETQVLVSKILGRDTSISSCLESLFILLEMSLLTSIRESKSSHVQMQETSRKKGQQETETPSRRSPSILSSGSSRNQ